MPKKIKNIVLKDWNNKPIDFFKFQGKNYLLLIFYRGYWCNICRAQLDEINKNLAKLSKKKAKVIAISGDEPLYASLLSTHLNAKFPILPDPEMKSFKKFGLKTSKDKIYSERGKRSEPSRREDILPAIFLISSQHEIIYKNISKDPEKRPNLDEIIKNI